MADDVNAEIEALRAQAAAAAAPSKPGVSSGGDTSVEDDLAKLRAAAALGDTSVTAPKQEAAPFDLGRTLTQVGRGAEEGVAGTLGLPGFLGNKLNALTGRQWSSSIHPPSPGDILGGASSLGIYDPSNAPRNELEKWAEFGGSAIPSLAIGAATGMPLWPNLAYSTVPGVVAKEAEEKLGVSPWITAPLTALAMSKGGAGINFVRAAQADKAAATQAGEAVSGAETAHTQAAADAAQRLAETQEHQLQRSDFSLGQKIDRWNTQDAALTQKQAELKDAADQHFAEHTAATADRDAIAAKLGKSQNVDDSAPIMQAKAREWLSGDGPENFPAKIKKVENGMYYKTDAQGNMLTDAQGNNIPLINEDSLGNLDNLRESITNSFGNAGLAEPVAAELRSKLPQRVLTQLDKIASAQGAAAGETATLPFRDIRALRTAIGNAMDSPEIIRSIGAQKIAEMYRAINNDARHTVAQAAGTEGLAAFDRFNQEAQRLYGIKAALGDNVVTTLNPARETIGNADVVKNLMANTGESGQLLEKLSSEPTLKQGLNEIAAARLRRGRGGDTNAGDPESEFKGLSPGAKTHLYGDDNSKAIQGVIDRRAAADNAQDAAKAQAEQTERNTLRTGMRTQASEIAAQSKAGTVASQASSNAARQQKAAAGALEEAQRNKKALDDIVASNKEKMWGWTKAKNWKVPGFGAVGGLGIQAVASGLGESLIGMAHNAMTNQPIGEIPNLAAYPLMFTAGGLAAGAAKQVIRHPDTVRNMLQGTIPAVSSTPNALGWSVTPSPRARK